MKYTFFEHTADMGVEAEAPTLEQVFSLTALGMQNMISDTSKVEEATSRIINVEAEDLKSLLYDFLEQFLILFDSEGLLFSRIEVKSIKQEENIYKLESKAYGDNFSSTKHESKTHVKAVTYHGMIVEKRGENWFTHVLFDI